MFERPLFLSSSDFRSSPACFAYYFSVVTVFAVLWASVRLSLLSGRLRQIVPSVASPPRLRKPHSSASPTPSVLTMTRALRSPICALASMFCRWRCVFIGDTVPARRDVSTRHHPRPTTSFTALLLFYCCFAAVAVLLLLLMLLLLLPPLLCTARKTFVW